MIPQTTDLPGTYISTVPLLDGPTVRAAALTVAEHAADPTEARLFLAQLGLCGQALPPREGERLACGHPATEGVRRPSTTGTVCRTCRRDEHRRNRQTRQEHAA